VSHKIDQLAMINNMYAIYSDGFYLQINSLYYVAIARRRIGNSVTITDTSTSQLRFTVTISTQVIFLFLSRVLLMGGVIGGTFLNL